MSKKKRFRRQNAHKHKRVSESWRKPRGKHSPMRRKEGHAPKMPNKGFRSPKNERGLHPSGLKAVLVHTPAEVEELDLDPELHAVRIGAGVGARKRERIVEAAHERDLKVLNHSVEEQAETQDEADEA